MSIWKQLYETYKIIEKRDDAKDLGNVDKFLLKDGLSVFKMSIEVTLNDNGELVDASLVPESDMSTIIPSTSSSAKRTNEVSAHPLFDKLEYLVSDWSNYVSDKSFVEKAYEKHINYLNNLEKWANYTQFNQVKILYNFIKNNNLLELLLNKIAFKEIKNLKENSVPDYKKLAGHTVRFRVGSEMPNEMWKNKALYDEWSSNYYEILGEKPLKEEISYINGEKENLLTFFPKFIRHAGDGAKLVSANDETIRTYGGRFKPGNFHQAVTIGHNSLIKSLYALKWLIKNQGFRYDDFVILTWSVENIEENNPFNYKYDETDDDLWDSIGNIQQDTLNSESNKVIKSVGYYGQYSKSLEKLKEKHLVNVATFDTSTTGRFAICYYNEFESEKYYSNIDNWFYKTKWMFRENDKNTLRTPTIKEIFKACYPHSDLNNKQDKVLYKAFLKEIFPCVMENRKLSPILVKRIFHNVVNRNSFKDFMSWWKVLCTFCALMNNYGFGGKYMEELDTENTNRSYLFGRLLAIAENIEYSATKNKGGSNSTNAERLFTQFTLRPGQTWLNLEKQLQPYFMKLYSQGSGGLVQFFKKSIQEIILKLGEEGLKSKKPLDEMFILGYYGQKSFGYKNEKNENTTEIEGE